ncbi:hypothetical protein L0V05_17530 [Tabrizicola sp. J26]|uniref:hypothetical protein n=1 Tax=Alitabrizicola rongguiensis TaxID=2909234 RepID=UPI001F481F5A|nr:hypothetical protein [Tabrizicola rongguiensis]MCF1710612.1 hypothetical protein [Tabrizicola rongguiensis]
MARDDQSTDPLEPRGHARAVLEARAIRAATLPPDRRNYLCDAAQPDPSRLYAGAGSVAETLRHLEPVAEHLVDDAWKVDALPGSMPAGYTFLAQLVAHDVAAHTFGPDETYRPDDARGHGLTLDSIFGPLSSARAMPKLYRFRLSASDPGRPVAVDLTWTGNTVDAHDARNGDTPFLSQLSALFVRYFDLAASALSEEFPEQRARLLARCLTAEVYLDIIEHDLLARLLHPAVLAMVRANGWRLVDLAAEREGFAIPVEFTNAAFRFGHAMVRSTYWLNDRSPVMPLGDLIGPVPPGLEGIRAGNSNFWRVDWRLFFGDGPQLQMARRIGPDLPPDLERVGKNRAIPGGRKSDLALRDLASSATGRLQSVAALAELLAPHLANRAGCAGWVLWSQAGRRAVMADWLSAQPGQAPDHLKLDPPLSLYLMVESGANGVDQGLGGGRTLGALGSTLVAEVLMPRLRMARNFIAAQPELNRARSIFPPPAGRAPEMWTLIEFLTGLE